MGVYNLYSKKLLEGHCFSKIYAYYSTDWAGQVMEHNHAHEWMEIMYMVKGRCAIEVNKETITLKSGEYIYIDSGIRHRLVIEKDQTCRMLNIEFGFEEGKNHIPVDQLIRNNVQVQQFIEAKQPYLHIKDYNDMYCVIKNLVSELHENTLQNADYIQLLLAQLIILLSRNGVNHMTSYKDIYVKKAIEFLDLKYDNPIMVKDVAAEVNVHPSYLYRIFKKHTGKTISEYLSEIRVANAKKLLERTDVPVIDIAGYVGFNSRQYFSSVFKKQTGLSPALYRKKYCNYMVNVV